VKEQRFFMANAVLYVHLETVSNLTVSYGMNADDFLAGIPDMPHHLLLLTPVNSQEIVDPHTGFNVISGVEDVERYLRDTKITPKKWIDYQHTLYLDQITPQEVAEMLYLGHAYNHLTPPFYYKLGNQYVYLDRPDGTQKIYYRNLDQFFVSLDHAIARHIREREVEQRFWRMLRNDTVAPLPDHLWVTLRPFLIDGVLFSFDEIRMHQKDYQIPLYRLRRKLLITDQTWLRGEDDLVGHLTYSRKQHTWRFESPTTERNGEDVDA
jgi:hypothetical protein